MLELTSIRDFRLNPAAAIRRVERGGRVMVMRRAKPVAVISPVQDDWNLEDLVLSSHRYFLKQYEKARRSSGVTLAELKRLLNGETPRRGKRSGRKADRKT